MIYILLYLLSLVIAPILAGLLDKMYDTDYPAENLVFIILSPLMCFIIVLAFVFELLYRLGLKLNEKEFNFPKRIYDYVKGKK